MDESLKKIQEILDKEGLSVDKLYDIMRGSREKEYEMSKHIQKRLAQAVDPVLDEARKNGIGLFVVGCIHSDIGSMTTSIANTDGNTEVVGQLATVIFNIIQSMTDGGRAINLTADADATAKLGDFLSNILNKNENDKAADGS